MFDELFGKLAAQAIFRSVGGGKAKQAARGFATEAETQTIICFFGAPNAQGL